MIDEPLEVLLREEVSEILKTSLRTVDYLVATGQIPFSRIGKRGVRFSRKRIEEWFLEERAGVEFHRDTDKK